MTREVRRTLQWLINSELEKEFEYQQINIANGHPYSDNLIRDLIKAEREIHEGEVGIEAYATNEIIKGDIEKYIKGLEVMAMMTKAKKEDE